MQNKEIKIFKLNVSFPSSTVIKVEQAGVSFEDACRAILLKPFIKFNNVVYNTMAIISISENH